MTKPILYSFRRCPYAMRARMAIWSSKLQVELREVVLRDKPEHMLQVSPKGTVPVLLLPDGTVVEESLEVMYWALENNDPDNWLVRQVSEKERLNALIQQCDGDFKHHLDRYKYASRYEGADAAEHRSEAVKFLLVLDAELTQSTYLGGEAPRLADFAIMPFIRQFANTDRTWFDAQPYPGLQRWLQTMLSCVPFTAVMAKYSQWHDGDQPITFPT